MPGFLLICSAVDACMNKLMAFHFISSTHCLCHLNHLLPLAPLRSPPAPAHNYTISLISLSFFPSCLLLLACSFLFCHLYPPPLSKAHSLSPAVTLKTDVAFITFMTNQLLLTLLSDLQKHKSPNEDEGKYKCFTQTTIDVPISFSPFIIQ